MRTMYETIIPTSYFSSHIRCLLKGEGGAAVKVSVTVKVHSEHFRLPYMSYFLFCHLPEQEIHDYKKVKADGSGLRESSSDLFRLFHPSGVRCQLKSQH